MSSHCNASSLVPGINLHRLPVAMFFHSKSGILRHVVRHIFTSASGVHTAYIFMSEMITSVNNVQLTSVEKFVSG